MVTRPEGTGVALVVHASQCCIFRMLLVFTLKTIVQGNNSVMYCYCGCYLVFSVIFSPVHPEVRLLGLRRF